MMTIHTHPHDDPKNPTNSNPDETKDEVIADDDDVRSNSGMTEAMHQILADRFDDPTDTLPTHSLDQSQDHITQHISRLPTPQEEMITTSKEEMITTRRRIYLQSVRLDYFQHHYLPSTSHSDLEEYRGEEWLRLLNILSETIPDAFPPLLDASEISTSEQDRYYDTLNHVRTTHEQDILQLSKQQTYRRTILHQWGLYLSNKYEEDLISTRVKWNRFKFK